MTATKPTPVYVSGLCAARRHERCAGDYRTAVCTCDCHQQPPPLPRLEPGARLTVAPGTRWARGRPRRAGGPQTTAARMVAAMDALPLPVTDGSTS